MQSECKPLPRQGCAMPDKTLLQQLRELRRKAEEMNRTLVNDYRPFLNPVDKTTFFRCPTDPPKPADVDPNITPTCTAFMALGLTDRLKTIYRPRSADDFPKVLKSRLSSAEMTERLEGGFSSPEVSTFLGDAMGRILRSKWETAGLDPNNAFTTSLVLRAAGILRVPDCSTQAIYRLSGEIGKTLTEPARSFRTGTEHSTISPCRRLPPLSWRACRKV